MDTKNRKVLCFDDIVAYTKTFIAVLNIDINLLQVFENFVITNWIIVKKRRGRIRKGQENKYAFLNKDVPNGSIISIKYKNLLKGVNLSKKKKCDKCYEICNCKKYFRNALTIIILTENKPINIKISTNGKIQMTGCKSSAQAYISLWYIWGKLKNHPSTYTFKNEHDFLPQCNTPNKLTCVLIPAMRNIDFSVGFKIDRRKFDNFINQHTQYNSLFETSFGYTGVNMKIQISQQDIDSQTIKLITYPEEQTGLVIVKKILYKEYISFANIVTKKKTNTFLIFHSGNVIMSGMSYHLMKSTFDIFNNLVINNRDKIEEKIITT